MSDYTKSTNFTTKDTLPTGDNNKKVKGAEIDTELNNISTAVNSKANTASPTLTGIPAAPTASTGTNTTQLSTTAFVTTAVAAVSSTLGTMSTQNKTAVDITGGTITGTYALSASALANTGGWAVTPSGATLYFSYNAVNVAKLDSSGNLTVKANITAYGTV